MAKSNLKRKTRSDKFPLTLHKTGQYCKNIRGKLYYFALTSSKPYKDIWIKLPIYMLANNPTPNLLLTDYLLKHCAICTWIIKTLGQQLER